MIGEIKTKRAELTAACDRASVVSANACHEVERLEKELAAARDAVTAADIAVLRIMEQIEALDNVAAALTAAAALGIALSDTAAGRDALAAGSPDVEPDHGHPPAGSIQVNITTKSVSELVREHLAARPGRNFTPAEMADAIFHEYPGSWRSPQAIIKAVSCALPRHGRRLETGRGVAYQANTRGAVA